MHHQQTFLEVSFLTLTKQSCTQGETPLLPWILYSFSSHFLCSSAPSYTLEFLNSGLLHPPLLYLPSSNSLPDIFLLFSSFLLLMTTYLPPTPIWADLYLSRLLPFILQHACAHYPFPILSSIIIRLCYGGWSSLYQKESKLLWIEGVRTSAVLSHPQKSYINNNIICMIMQCLSVQVHTFLLVLMYQSWHNYTCSANSLQCIYYDLPAPCHVYMTHCMYIRLHSMVLFCLIELIILDFAVV